MFNQKCQITEAVEIISLFKTIIFGFVIIKIIGEEKILIDRLVWNCIYELARK